jgi:Domain of unknown function (DUF4440)
MRSPTLSYAAAVMVSAGALLAAQTPLSLDEAALRSHAALQALDRYLETWNSREPMRWAGSLHFPHVRPGPGEFAVSQTADEYARGVNFDQTLSTGWHHSEWDSRRVLQIGLDKVHVSGQWTRYTAEGKTLTGSLITYIVTNQRGRWGVLSRFAAGPTRVEPARTSSNASAALAALKDYFQAWNSHDPAALAASMHFPFVRIADGQIDVAKSAAEFQHGGEPGRQRTWFETTFDRVEVVQVSANGANVTFTYHRRGRGGPPMSSYEALALLTERDGRWKLQALSTMGP